MPPDLFPRCPVILQFLMPVNFPSRSRVYRGATLLHRIMTNCSPWEELNALIDGELTGKRELHVRWHLEICNSCAHHAAAVVTLKRAVGRMRERDMPSPALRRHVLTRMTS